MRNRFFVLIFLTLPLLGLAQRPNSRGLVVPTKQRARQGFIFLNEAKPLGPVQHLPAIDLGPQLPIPGSQGSIQGSCAAWATCYGLMSFLQAQVNHWPLNNGGVADPDHVFSPAYLYNQLNKDPTCAEGLLLDTVMTELQTMGTVPLTDFPYDPNSCNSLPDPSNLPRKAVLLDATTIYNWWAISDNQVIDTSEVKDVLNQGYPVVLGVHIDPTFEGFYYNQYTPPDGPYYIWNTFSNPPIDSFYHAMLCVGYDDNIGAFKIMNSWGTGFANSGFIWVSYSIFTQVIMEAYYSTLIPAGITLAKPQSKETRRGPENEVTTNSAGATENVSWLQTGSYRNFGVYEVSCLYANKDSQTVVLQIRDTVSKRFTRVLLNKKTGVASKQFLHNGQNVRLSLNRVSELSPADRRNTAFFTLTVRQQKNMK